jgi:hypothetical protein
MTLVNPLREHLLSGEFGDETHKIDVLALADRIGEPLTFDLLRMTPAEARYDLCLRMARRVLDKHGRRA